MNNISEKGSDFIQDLGDAARKNPLSAALIGMGVLWLFAGSRPVERVSDFARGTGLDRIPDAAGNAFHAARSTLRSGTDAVGERVSSAKDVVKDGVVDALDSATRYGREYADTAPIPRSPDPVRRFSIPFAQIYRIFSRLSHWRWAPSELPLAPALQPLCRELRSKLTISVKPATR